MVIKIWRYENKILSRKCYAIIKKALNEWLEPIADEKHNNLNN